MRSPVVITRSPVLAIAFLTGLAVLAVHVPRAAAQAPTPTLAPTESSQITLSIPSMEGPEQVVPAIKILILIAVLSLAPGILVSVTSFTRIMIVLSFLRQALGTQSVPPHQVTASLALFMTAVVMAPVAKRIDEGAFEPYANHQITGEQAYEVTAGAVRDWMLKQTREQDLLMYYEISQTPRPATVEETSLYLLIPAFMTSELRTGFEMGFLLFLPFILIDLVVSSLLTAMGIIMLPPTVMSMPLKILLFVVVDGWSLMTRSLVASFS